MRTLALLLLLASAPAISCDLLFGAGAAHRYQDGYSGATGKVTCAFNEGRGEVALHGFGRQSLYGGRLEIDPYAALTIQRIVTWRQDKFLRPYIAVGFMLKAPDRCHDTWKEVKGKGSKKPKRRRVLDLDCNRLVPEWWSWALTAGLGLGDRGRLLLVNHWSTGGVSFPNSGQDFTLPEIRVQWGVK